MIAQNVLVRIVKNKIRLEEAFILWNKYFLKAYLTLYRVSPEYWDSLIASGYMTNSKELTAKGSSLCAILFPSEEVIPMVTSKPTDNFEEFWEAFPADDKFGNFTRTRYIRTAKTKAKLMYTKLIDSKKVTHENLMKAIQAEVSFRKSTSFKENQLKYMSSPYTWLYNENYSTILESSEDEPQSQDFYGKEIY